MDTYQMQGLVSTAQPEMGIFPKGYSPKLDFFETERGIKLVKDTFERELANRLNLHRVSAPRFLKVGDGLQDDLAGTQVPVGFKTTFLDEEVEIVHSLAKWKRMALGKYGFKTGVGLYTDMDAVRKDEMVDMIHSVYVDQWDWEKVIRQEDRTIPYLQSTVRKIYDAMQGTSAAIKREFPHLGHELPEEIKFIHSEELEERYPDFSPKERETAAAKKYGAIFVMGIGYPLKSGSPHDVRAADYDDWSTEGYKGMPGLNGDIIVWDSIRKDALEISSMGIRVDALAMEKQLDMAGLTDRKSLMFHKGVIDGTIPLSIGGGIGQSRLCMYMLDKAHIGEVQSSVWPVETIDTFRKYDVPLL